jgi:hypothetical protein
MIVANTWIAMKIFNAEPDHTGHGRRIRGSGLKLFSSA